MPRAIVKEADLPTDVQAQRTTERARQQERDKNPVTLSLPDRVKRLETILGVT